MHDTSAAEAEAARLDTCAHQLKERAASLATLRTKLAENFRGPAAQRQQERLLRHQRQLSEMSAEAASLARALRKWAQSQPVPRTPYENPAR